MMEKSLLAKNKVLLDLLANSLFGANIEIDLSGIELGQLFEEAKAQTVLAWAFDALPPEARALDAEVYDKWRFLAVSITRKNLSQMRSNAELEKIFNEANMPICTIKGFASGYYYGGKKHLRQMGDIDFIVPVAKMPDSEKLLLAHHFVREEGNRDHEFHVAFQKNHELYEMHQGITSIEDSNADVQNYLSELFSNAQKVQFDDVQITIPDPFFHGLIMLLHMKRHMLSGGGIGLRHLCDWAAFVDSIEGEDWVCMFEEKLKKEKLWKFAQAFSKVAAVYLKIEEKEWFGTIAVPLAEKLLIDIVSGGNFGKKSIKRYQETAFISKKDVSESKWVYYMKGIRDRVYIWKPFYNRHKALLPFGFAAYAFRILFLVITAQKKLNVFEIHKRGQERNKLYQALFR